MNLSINFEMEIVILTIGRSIRNSMTNAYEVKMEILTESIDSHKSRVKINSTSDNLCYNSISTIFIVFYSLYIHRTCKQMSKNAFVFMTFFSPNSRERNKCVK